MGIVADRMIESDRTQPLTLDQFGKLSLSSLFGTPLSSARARSYSDETPQAKWLWCYKSRLKFERWQTGVLISYCVRRNGRDHRLKIFCDRWERWLSSFNSVIPPWSEFGCAAFSANRISKILKIRYVPETSFAVLLQSFFLSSASCLAMFCGCVSGKLCPMQSSPLGWHHWDRMWTRHDGTRIRCSYSSSAFVFQYFWTSESN